MSSTTPEPDIRDRAAALSAAGDHSSAAIILERQLEASLVVGAIPDRAHREILYRAVKDIAGFADVVLPTLQRMKRNLRSMAIAMAHGGHDPLKTDAEGQPTHEAHAMMGSVWMVRLLSGEPWWRQNAICPTAAMM